MAFYLLWRRVLFLSHNIFIFFIFLLCSFTCIEHLYFLHRKCIYPYIIKIVKNQYTSIQFSMLCYIFCNIYMLYNTIPAL